MASSTRKNIEPVKLYKRAAKEKNGRIRARLLGIASVIEGKKIAEAAQIAGIAKTNLHKWIKEFNKHGIEGIVENRWRGRQSTWTPEEEEFLKEKALNGARLEIDKRIAYRLSDFQALLKERFGKHYASSTICYKLQELELFWISVR